MKKLILIIITLFIAMSFVCANTFVGASEYFSDLNENDYCYNQAKAMFDAGLISGYADGTFRPEVNVTRAEMATFICRALGQESVAKQNAGTTTDLTTDVDINHWASGYVYWAVSQKIINGYGDGRFLPDKNVSYKEAIKMVVCAIGLEAEVVADPYDWAKGYFDVANQYGITRFTKLGQELNAEYVTRGDIVIMLHNAIKDKLNDFNEKDNEQSQQISDNSNKHTLTVKMLGCGGIRNTSGKYYTGDNVPLYILPETKTAFISWISSAGELIMPDNPNAMITMPNEDVVVYATFTPDGSAPKGGEYYIDGGNGEFIYVDNPEVKVDSPSGSAYDEEYQEKLDDLIKYAFYDDEVSYELEQEVFRLVNEERIKHGLKKVYIDDSLALRHAAIYHSADMHLRNFFSHVNPDGDTPADRLTWYNPKFNTVGENIAKGQTSAKEVMDAWMNSPEHRANILNENFYYLGVGLVRYNGEYIWTQCFKG